jgi:Leucine-rich repeat (LRR) protein
MSRLDKIRTLLQSEDLETVRAGLDLVETMVMAGMMELDGLLGAVELGKGGRPIAEGLSELPHRYFVALWALGLRAMEDPAFGPTEIAMPWRGRRGYLDPKREKRDLPLEVLPDNFGALTTLQKVDLSRHRLEKLPAQLRQLPRLREVALKGNRISSVDLAILERLDFLDLTSNPIHIGWESLRPHLRDIGTDSRGRIATVPQLMANGLRTEDLLAGLVEAVEHGRCPPPERLELKNLRHMAFPDGFQRLLHSFRITPRGRLEFKPHIENRGGRERLDGFALQALCRELDEGKPIGGERLDLSRKKLQELPGGISMILGMKELCLQGNRKLEELPAELGSLPLDVLDLRKTQVGSLPTGLLERASTIRPGSKGHGFPLKVLHSGPLAAQLDPARKDGLARFFQTGAAVLRLGLADHGMASIPPGIGKLEGMEELDLSGNVLMEVPGLSYLAGLRKLDLAQNRLEHHPSLCAFPALESIDLQKNPLRELPDGIWDHPRLERICLGGHGMELGEVPEAGLSLRELRLDGMGLDRLPLSALGSPSMLDTLSLKGNNIGQLGKDLGSLSGLRNLFLSENPLESLPKEIGGLTGLRELFLNRTRLRSLPQELTRLADLELLSLPFSSLETLPEAIGELVGLRKLLLHSTPLQILPESIGALGNLEELWLIGTQVKRLPESMGGMRSLRILKLHGSAVETLPDSLAELPDLVVWIGRGQWRLLRQADKYGLRIRRL